VLGGSEHGQEQGLGNTSSVKYKFPGIPLDPDVLIEKKDTISLEVEFTTVEGKAL
jgi:hypothetical protein